LDFDKVNEAIRKVHKALADKSFQEWIQDNFDKLEEKYKEYEASFSWSMFDWPDAFDLYCLQVYIRARGKDIR